jgi:hypothetical protein
MSFLTAVMQDTARKYKQALDFVISLSIYNYYPIFNAGCAWMKPAKLIERLLILTFFKFLFDFNCIHLF